ncbi:MAG: CDP-alcohol phosphatidyltransferase family protein [Spirochaetaceae bacterium]|nr:MAG: CDP-alcohol phosphatidyltransferase family protein [Spirochaetaceae bacterium]
MFDHVLRRGKDHLLAPLVRVAGSRFHPNLISVAAAVIGVAAAVALANGAYGLAAALWVSNRLVDGLDGAVARATGQTSEFGGYLDLMLDVVVYSAIPIGFALHRPEPEVFLAVTLLLAACYINITSWLYLSVLIERHRQSREFAAAPQRLTAIAMPRGLVEGAETIVAYLVLMLFPDYAVVILLITAAAILVGAVQRMIWSVGRFPGGGP